MILITSMLASFFVYQWHKTGFLYAFAMAVFVEVMFLMILSFVLQKHDNRVKKAKQALAGEKNNRAELERQITSLNQKIEDQKKEMKETFLALSEQKSKFAEYGAKENRYKKTIEEMSAEIESMKREIASYKHRLGIDE